MKHYVLHLLALTLVVLSAGCASNSVLVSAQRDSHFSPTPADKINMALRPNPSPEDAQLGSALLAELTKENFNIVTNSDADYTLTYLVEDDSTEQTYQHQEVIPAAPAQTTKDIVIPGMVNSSQYDSQRITMVPTTLVFRSQGIRLYLYANPKTHPGGLQVAWTGCIEAGEKISAEREPLLIETLLGYFGKDYTGRVSLPK